MKDLIWLLLFLMLCPLSNAQSSLDTEAVKKMIVFIYRAASDGSPDENRPLGTGFLIVPPEAIAPDQPKNNALRVKGHILLITARHIVDPNWAYCSEPQPSLIYLRVNKTNYDPAKDKTGVKFLPVHLLENGVKQYFIRDDDDKVDAAVVDLGSQMLQSEYDFIPMRLSAFANSDEIKRLRIGDAVVSGGLIVGESGNNRNYPFFKFGAISNIPDEPTWTGCPGKRLRLERVWFINANLVGGNSGSPIFYDPPALCLLGTFITCPRGLNRPMLIGVQSESLGDAQFGNSALSGMTPIEDVFKIIEQHASPNADLYRGNEAKRK
jgi:hypothetical protein